MLFYSFRIFTHQFLRLKLVTDVVIGKICGKLGAMLLACAVVETAGGHSTDFNRDAKV